MRQGAVPFRVKFAGFLIIAHCFDGNGDVGEDKGDDDTDEGSNDKRKFENVPTLPKTF